MRPAPLAGEASCADGTPRRGASCADGTRGRCPLDSRWGYAPDPGDAFASLLRLRAGRGLGLMLRADTGTGSPAKKAGGTAGSLRCRGICFCISMV